MTDPSRIAAGDAPVLPYLRGTERDMAIVRQGRIFRAATVTTHDDVALTALEAGRPDAAVVLVVNALGVSCLFLAPVAARLAEDHLVLCWETRGLPDAAACRADVDLSLDRHVQDLRAVVGGRRVAAVVSYCSGAGIALQALATGALDAACLCLVSPSITLHEAGGRTDYQRKMLPLWQKISKAGLPLAALVRALLSEGAARGAGLEAELDVLNNLPFRSDASTFRYACMQANLSAQDWAPTLRRIEVPALVLHASLDTLIHRDSVEAIARLLPRGSFAEIEGASHYGMSSSESLMQRVVAFVDRFGTRRLHGQAVCDGDAGSTDTKRDGHV